MDVLEVLLAKKDEECVEHLQQYLGTLPPDDERWQITNNPKGNIYLHYALMSGKPKAAQWLITNSGVMLPGHRNHEDDTPRQALESLLEFNRTTMASSFMMVSQSVSDDFKGLSTALLECLILVKGLESPHALGNATSVARLKFGCTCGLCLDGFLSPRMSFALLGQAEISHDQLLDSDHRFMGMDFVEWNQEAVHFLAPQVRANLKTNKNMRAGFVALFDHLATCMKNKQMPSQTAILQAVQKAGEWPPVTRNFHERGDTVSAVASAIFSGVAAQDRWAGDGEHYELVKNDIEGLPECRNDHHFGSVSGMCGFERQLRY